LRRLVLASMLWEDTFYVDGVDSAKMIEEVCGQIKPNQIVDIALEAHEKGLLRHMPLYLIVQALKRGATCKNAISTVCNRPDQMTELLSLYWKNGKTPLASQLKRGLAHAFTRFDAYQLAKYNRDNPIKLRDILFLCHAKPKDESQAETWKQLVSNTLPTPDTWETRLSAGNDKKDSFQELLEAGKMGRLAIIRNLRNMFEAGVPKDLVRSSLLKKSRPLLPFQFLAAAKACPQWEDIADESMIQSMQERPKMLGKTSVFVDVSGSMIDKISSKSETLRVDAAAGIAIMLREMCPNVEFHTFSNHLALIPNRQGMALRDAIVKSQPMSGTYLGNALSLYNQTYPNKRNDRVIVITDEQVNDLVPEVYADRCYIINVGNYPNGIKNNGRWFTITGFSENVIDYILEIEKENT